MLLAPPVGLHSEHHYRISARPKRQFHTVLDASSLLDPSRESIVRIDSGPERITLHLEHPIRGSVIEEELTLLRQGDRMRSERLVRSVLDGERVVRREEVHFLGDVLPMPEQAYPEVMLPFVLAWQPFDGSTRALYAWICDRFVAASRYEGRGTQKLDLPLGKRSARYMVMYPDLNDWVNMGRVLTRLAKPLLPRYDMWFATDAPHTVLRYEGPYGPPGAPEIILELIK